MNPPIKRSKNLVPLSKDHHEGLLVVWKIRQGLRTGIAGQRIVDFVVHAFDEHLVSHFWEEEELLFTQLTSDNKLRTKAIAQHEAIRKIVAELRSMVQPNTAQLEEFANRLEEHIRFEERELFVYLESEVADEIMADIGAQLESIHKNHHPLSWKDEFWMRK